jgi:integrase
VKLIPEKDFPELQRHPVTKIWYVRKFVTGKGELFKSTREKKSKIKAKSIALKILSDFIGGSYKGHAYKFRDLAAEVIAQKASKSEATRYSAWHHLENRINPVLGNFRISQVNESVIKDYFNQCRVKNPNGKLFNDWKHIVMVMRRAWEKGLLPRPMILKNPDGATDPKYVFTDAEEKLLLDNANPKLRLQILIGLRMGMRPGEVLRLQLDRIDLPAGMINLKASDTKTRTPREVPIHGDVRAALQEAMAEAQGKYLFGNRDDANRAPVRNANRPNFERLKEKVGIERGTLHDLRRTCATRMGRSPLPAAVACKILGMSLKTFMAVYCKPTGEELSQSYHEHFAGQSRVKSGKVTKRRTKDE